METIQPQERVTEVAFTGTPSYSTIYFVNEKYNWKF